MANNPSIYTLQIGRRADLFPRYRAIELSCFWVERMTANEESCLVLETISGADTATR
jgi:hypothetical protein